MHTSRLFKSSPHCIVSPDGKLIATLSSSGISLRSTETLQAVAAVKLPSDVKGPISAFAWSPSSSKILVTAGDQIRAFTIGDSSSHATIRNPVSSSKKPSVVQFGAHDSEILVCAAFGLKFVMFDMSTAKATEVNNPKFYLPSSASRGFSIRPHAAHLALLTRTSGKDMVSIHHPVTRQVQRCWHPDTADAQGLAWTPDGNWLLLWESPAHGHKLLLYTPDGQLFRAIGASSLVGGPDADLQPGMKLCRSSPDAAYCAVGDHSRTVAVLDTQTWRVGLRLLHPTTITPRDTLQVWQEQLGTSTEGRPTHTFQRATQMISPPGRVTEGKQSAEAKSGCSLALFDTSSTLLATRLDDSPCTVWIWDVAAAELRAVLIFHSTVSFSWHPYAREQLLVTCQDEDFSGVSFIWDPLSSGPKYVSLRDHVADGKIAGKPQSIWISRETESPVLLLSDAQRYVLVYCTDADTCPTPWREAKGFDWGFGSGPEGLSILNGVDDREISGLVEDDTSTLDDTFSFKHT